MSGAWLDASARLHRAHCLARLESLFEPTRTSLSALEQEAARRHPGLPLHEVHRQLARELAASLDERVRSSDWPDEVVRGFEQERDRIATEAERKPDAHFSLSNYRFKADLRILCLRRIPAGMYDLEVGAIPKRLLTGQGLRQGLRLAGVIARAGGFAPFFNQHLSPHRMKLFSPLERQRFLLRVADLLRSRPSIRGLMSTAWYNDPAVSEFSPQLAYLREGWERWGEGVFRIGTSPEVRHDATAFSFDRRRLVESGRYLPTAYLGVALRGRLLRLSQALETDHGA